MTRSRTRTMFVTSLFCLAFLLTCSALWAQTFSHSLSFQGRLSEPNGKPLPDGPYQVQFTIYDAETEGNALWQETQDVTQAASMFTVYLGSETSFPADLFTGGDRWLGLRIGEDEEIAERFRFTPSPWAIYAASAPPDDDWQTSGDDIHRADGNVGVGTANPIERLDVAGTAQVSGFKLPTGASPGYVLTSDAVGLGTWEEAAGGMGGGGSATYIPKFTEAHTLGNSVIYEGTEGKVGIGTEEPDSPLAVDGMVESMEGGFKFPDGTIQKTAAPTGPEGGADGRYVVAMYCQAWPGSWDFYGEEDSFKVLDLRWSFNQPFDPPTGEPAGRRQHEVLTVVKNVDKASVQLARALTTGETSPVRIRFYWFYGSDHDRYYEVSLTDARVVDFHHIVVHRSGDEYVHLDQVSLVYGSVEWNWLPDGIYHQDNWRQLGP